jgi:hypothetical protein
MIRHFRMAKHFRLGSALAASVLMVAGSGSGWAASHRIALVVGDGQYAGRPALPACSTAAHAVSARLQREGFIVHEAIDGSATTLRDVLGDFAGRAATLHEPALVYVCAEAAAVGGRLFVLPSDIDLRRPLQPETQGVVLRALLNAMAGTEGTMIAELGLLPGTTPAPVTVASEEDVPEGLHLALTVGDGKQAGKLGTRLAEDATSLDRGWAPLAAALQGASQDMLTAVTLYVPPPDEAEEETVLPDAQQPAKPSGEERVRRLQLALTKHGLYGGPLDGVANARTLQAILSYQISIGDPPSGTLTQTEIVRMLDNR